MDLLRAAGLGALLFWGSDTPCNALDTRRNDPGQAPDGSDPNAPGHGNTPNATPEATPPQPQTASSGAGARGGGGRKWTSRPYFHHTFDTHGRNEGRNLTGRAGGTNKEQGHWLNNDLAAQILSGLDGLISEPTIITIPSGLGEVIMPDGTKVPVEHALVIPEPGGGFRTAFPIIP